ncbi:MAG: transposase family protein [Planctomycetaceae bacterium]
MTVQLVIEAPKRRSTDQFERYALQLAQIATTHTVANHLNVSWNAILEMIV